MGASRPRVGKGRLLPQEIYKFVLLQEEGIAKGIRRIVAVTGLARGLCEPRPEKMGEKTRTSSSCGGDPQGEEPELLVSILLSRAFSSGMVDFPRALSVQVRIWTASRACLLVQSLTNALAIYAEESQRTVMLSLGMETLWIKAAVLSHEIIQDKEVSLLMKSDIMTELETLQPARVFV